MDVTTVLALGRSLSIMVLGCTLRHCQILTADDARALTKVVIWVTVPALLLHAFWTEQDTEASLLLIPLLAFLTALISGGMGWFFFRRSAREQRGLLICCCMGWNVGLFGFPFAEALYGNAGFRALALFDLGNVLINYGVSYAVALRNSPLLEENPSSVDLQVDTFEHGLRVGETRNMSVGDVSPTSPPPVMKVDKRRIAYKVATFPPLVCCLLGAALRVADVPPYPFVQDLLTMMGAANGPMALLALGLFFDPANITAAQLLLSLKVQLIRWVIPGVILGAVALTAPELLAANVLAQASAIATLMPAGMVLLAYAAEFGYETAPFAVIINVSQIFSLATMAVFLACVGRPAGADTPASLDSMHVMGTALPIASFLIN